MENQSEILFYTANDGKTKLLVRLEDETVWLTQKQIAELFDRSRVTVTEHIKTYLPRANWRKIQYVENSDILPKTKRLTTLNIITSL